MHHFDAAVLSSVPTCLLKDKTCSAVSPHCCGSSLEVHAAATKNCSACLGFQEIHTRTEGEVIAVGGEESRELRQTGCTVQRNSDHRLIPGFQSTAVSVVRKDFIYLLKAVWAKYGPPSDWIWPACGQVPTHWIWLAGSRQLGLHS